MLPKSKNKVPKGESKTAKEIRMKMKQAELDNKEEKSFLNDLKKFMKGKGK